MRPAGFPPIETSKYTWRNGTQLETGSGGSVVPVPTHNPKLLEWSYIDLP